ncbi:MAG: WD40 repeat domain-containing protein, partial [Isosphaeraceae bacterium]
NRGIVRFWDLQTGASREFAASVHAGPMISGAAWFSPDARTIAATALNGEVLLIDAVTGTIRGRLNRANQLALSVAFTNDSKTIAVGSVEARVDLFDVATCEPKGSCAPPSSNATALAFTDDGRGLAVASGIDGTVTIWDVLRCEKRLTLEGVGRNRGLAFTSDNEFLVGGSPVAKVAVWTLSGKW